MSGDVQIPGSVQTSGGFQTSSNTKRFNADTMLTQTPSREDFVMCSAGGDLTPVKTPSGVGATSGYDGSLRRSGAELFWLRHGFFQMVEELRVRRALEEENDQRVKQLLVEKCDLQTNLDAVQKRCCEMRMEQDNAVSNEKQSQLHNINQLRHEKAMLTLQNDRLEAEQKTLSLHVRKLELSRYELEKRTAEQDKKLRINGVSGSLDHSLFLEVEELMAQVRKNQERLSQRVNRLEQNVHLAQRVTKALETKGKELRRNVGERDDTIKQLHEKIAELRVELVQQPSDLVHEISSVRGERDQLKTMLRTTQEKVRRLEEQLVEASHLNNIALKGRALVQ